MEHRPLLGQVLAGRQPRRVVSAPPHLPLGPRPEHGAYTSPDGSVATKAYVRPRAYVRVQGPGRGRLAAADGLERRARGAGVRGAAADAEGARDRAARRLAARRGRLPAPHRARARRDRARAPDADADRGDAARSSSRSTPPPIVLGRPTAGSRRATTASRRSRCSTRRSTAAPPDEELERLRILARTPRWGREIDEARPSGRGGPRRARDLVHEGLLPGPGADRAAALTAATRTARCACSRSTAAAPGGDEVRLGEQGGRPRHERRARPRARLRPRRGAGRRRARGRGPPRAATLTRPAPVAQGIERCPAEAEVASSNLAGRIP